MAQMGSFDLSDRYESLNAKRVPLVGIDTAVPWEEFRPVLEQVPRAKQSENPASIRMRTRGWGLANHGRDASRWTQMFKTPVLSAFYNSSDDQIEYQVRDRLSFMRLIGLASRTWCLMPTRCSSSETRVCRTPALMAQQNQFSPH